MRQPQISVSGGAGGLEADFEDLALLARDSDDLAGTLAQISAMSHAILVNPDVLASGVLDPDGAAKFEATLMSALDGKRGLTALAVRYGTRAIELRATAVAYQEADAASRQLIDRLRWAGGYLFVATLPFSAGVLLLGGAAILGNAFLLDPEGTVKALSDPQRFLTDHPGTLDTVVGASPGLITGLTGLPAGNVTSGAHLLGLLYPDGHAKVTAEGIDTNPQVARVPQGIGDLMTGLDHRNTKAHVGDDQIDVRVLTRPDGTKSYIVDIPGTKDWNLPASGINPNSNDLGTNVHVLGGDVTAREHAIADALGRAGASSTDAVMLVGHSQGGMVAAQAAADTSTGKFNYHVTHIVTAGSPIAHADIPSHVQVLSIENSHDLVPHLDAADNPDHPNWTTVTVDHQLGSAGANHSTDRSYVPAAEQIDHSTDPSITAFRNSASAFLPASSSGTTVQADVYQLSRVR